MRFSRKVVVINSEKCRRCNLCVPACPLSALSPPRVDHKLCVGCGLCTYKCPFGAMEIVEKRSAAAIAVVLIAVLLAVASILAIFYIVPQSTPPPLNYTEMLPQYYTPSNLSLPKGEEAAGAGSGFG